MFFRADWVKAAATQPQRDSAPDKISPVISCLCAPQPHPYNQSTCERTEREKTCFKDRHEIEAASSLDEARGQSVMSIKTITAILDKISQKTVSDQ